jgi:hypothetical protein
MRSVVDRNVVMLHIPVLHRFFYVPCSVSGSDMYNFFKKDHQMQLGVLLLLLLLLLHCNNRHISASHVASFKEVRRRIRLKLMRVVLTL